MKAGRFERLELDVTELDDILERARTMPLSEEDHRKLKAAMETLVLRVGIIKAPSRIVNQLFKFT